MIGGAEPKYSVPPITYSSVTSAPAPRMLPVCGKPGIGTACNLKATVGAADAKPGRASKASPRTATQVCALRIMSFSSFDDLLAGRRQNPGQTDEIQRRQASRSILGPIYGSRP